MIALKSLSDKELISNLKKLVSQDQNLTLKILPHLVEVERREIYLEKAYSTMTHYCVNELGYGESSASRRVRAARAHLNRVIWPVTVTGQITHVTKTRHRNRSDRSSRW